MPELFDPHLRALHRDRAARRGPELFLHERAFEDCLERIGLSHRKFASALLIGCPDPSWPERLRTVAATIDVRDPGPLFAKSARGKTIIEDSGDYPKNAFELVVAIGTLDTVNDLPLVLQMICWSMRGDGLFIGALSGGDTLPQLRHAMRAADARSAGAAPHVHPRIEASALAPLIEHAGFIHPVVDVDRVPVSYRSFDRLVGDLRAMAGSNVLYERPKFISRLARAAAAQSFRQAGDGSRTVEIFEILHFAAWTPPQG